MEEYKLIKGDWQKWPIPVVQFAIQQADNNLKQYIELSKKISDRAFSLLTTCTTLFIIIAGWLLTNILKYSGNNVLITIAGEILILLTIALFILFTLLYPYNLYSAGSSPRNLLREELLKYPFADKSEMELCILLQECEDLQIRIDHNRQSNEKRQIGIEWVLRILIAILPVSVLTYIIFP